MPHRSASDGSAEPVKAETELYAPVKAFLEGQGYVVKGEVRGCDVVGVRGAEPPVVVELKRSFSLALVLQGVERLALTDRVYLAVGERPRRLRDVRRLCRRLGCGLLVVTRRVEVVLDPLPYAPRKAARHTAMLLGEHARRVGDPNPGGMAMRAPIMTAYRQQALRCATLLAEHGPMTLGAMRAAGDVPDAARILHQDHYGWFQRVERATYELTPEGHRGLERFGSPVAWAGAATTNLADSQSVARSARGRARMAPRVGGSGSVHGSTRPWSSSMSEVDEAIGDAPGEPEGMPASAGP